MRPEFQSAEAASEVNLLGWRLDFDGEPRSVSDPSPPFSFFPIFLAILPQTPGRGSLRDHGDFLSEFGGRLHGHWFLVKEGVPAEAVEFAEGDFSGDCLPISMPDDFAFFQHDDVEVLIFILSQASGKWTILIKCGFSSGENVSS
jgi:hypothetical protein